MSIISEGIVQPRFLTGPWVVVGVGLCAALIVILADWRVTVLAFAAQSVLLAMLTTRLLPFEWAMLRMLVGGLVALLWFMSARRVRWGHHLRQLRQREGEMGRQGDLQFAGLESYRRSPRLLVSLSPRLRRRGERWPSLSTGTLLRLLATCLVILIFFRLEGRVTLPALPSDLSLVCAWLWLMGFLAMALSDEPLRTGLGLLTMSAGFQLLYAALEPSSIAVGLLGSLDLLLGLAVAYLMVAYGVAGRPRLVRGLGMQSSEDGVAEGEER